MSGVFGWSGERSCSPPFVTRVRYRFEAAALLCRPDLAIPEDAGRISDRLLRIGLGFAGVAFPPQVLGAAVRVKDDGHKPVPDATCDGRGPGGDLLHRPPPGPGTSMASRASSARRQVRVSPASNASPDAIIMMATRFSSWGVAATWLSSTSSAFERVKRRSPTPLLMWTGMVSALPQFQAGGRGRR